MWQSFDEKENAMKTRIFALLLCLVLLLTGCSKGGNNGDGTQGNGGNPNNTETGTQGEVADLGDDNKTFGEDIEDEGAYDGYFEGESADIVVECVSGTDKAYKLEGTTLTFGAIGEETVYSISGTFRGNIVIDVGEGYKFDLELCGLSLVCNSTNPITVISGDEVAIKAKRTRKTIFTICALPLTLPMIRSIRVQFTPTLTLRSEARES